MSDVPNKPRLKNEKLTPLWKKKKRNSLEKIKPFFFFPKKKLSKIKEKSKPLEKKNNRYENKCVMT